MGQKMSEYFIKIEIFFYQHSSETRTYFVNADCGQEAYNKLVEKIEYTQSGIPMAREITNIILLDINKL